MIPGCTQFYYTVSNDDCSKITEHYKVSIDDFVTWNPDAGAADTCTVWLNYYYCVSH